MSKRVIVIGAGPAGLSVASGLNDRNVETLVLEASAPGGLARSIRRDGWLAECGPHSFRLRGNKHPRVLAPHKINAELTPAGDAANRRFITTNGVPVTAPFRALGVAGSLRLFAEPFVAAGGNDDESVADFFKRRLGVRAHERLGDAFVGGIHAGDPEKLSLAHAFPELRRFERDHGSILKGLFATRRERRDSGPARIVAFRRGMSQFAELMAERFGDALKTGATVTAVERTPGGWRVAWTGSDGGRFVESADSVVVATPAHAWEKLGLPGIVAPAPYYAPVAVVTLGYARDKVAHPLDGFGVLSPACEKRDALGIVFPSSVFAGRAPDGGVTLAVFVGGARRRELATLPEPELVALARRECGQLLGATGTPEFVHVAAWRHAIPQYELSGYGKFLENLAAFESANPGLHFTGNFRGGVSIVAAMENADALAERISG